MRWVGRGSQVAEGGHQIVGDTRGDRPTAPGA